MTTKARSGDTGDNTEPGGSVGIPPVDTRTGRAKTAEPVKEPAKDENQMGGRFETGAFSERAEYDRDQAVNSGPDRPYTTSDRPFQDPAELTKTTDEGRSK